MKKHFKNILVIIATLTTINSKASHYEKKSFFDNSTKDVITKSAQFYATSSLVFYGVGKTLQVLSGAPFLGGGINVNFDVLYNDTFPKDYYIRAIQKSNLPAWSRDLLIAGSVCSAPLRSVISTTLAFVLLPAVAVSIKKNTQRSFSSPELSREKVHSGMSNATIAKETGKAFIKQMTVSPRYGIIGFGLPVAYHKYQESRY